MTSPVTEGTHVDVPVEFGKDRMKRNSYWQRLRTGAQRTFLERLTSLGFGGGPSECGLRDVAQKQVPDGRYVV
jgi:hypothetical protein